MPLTLRNLKEDLDDVGSNFDGAPGLEFRVATKTLELEQSGLCYQRVPDVVRVPPDTWRGYESGAQGLEILVVGAPNLGENPRGDVEGQRDGMNSTWWNEGRRRESSPAQTMTGESRRAATVPVLRLQRMAGNRSVARLVRRDPSAGVLQRQSAPKHWQILVHPSSQLDAAEIVKIVKGNPNLDSWLTAGFSATGGSIAVSPKLAPPKTVPNEYLGSLKKAFESGNWVLTTAELRITAKAVKDPPASAQDWSWTKATVPDLAEGEELGTWGKSGFHAAPMISRGAPGVDLILLRPSSTR